MMVINVCGAVRAGMGASAPGAAAMAIQFLVIRNLVEVFTHSVEIARLATFCVRLIHGGIYLAGFVSAVIILMIVMVEHVAVLRVMFVVGLMYLMSAMNAVLAMVTVMEMMVGECTAKQKTIVIMSLPAAFVSIEARQKENIIIFVRD